MSWIVISGLLIILGLVIFINYKQVKTIKRIEKEVFSQSNQVINTILEKGEKAEEDFEKFIKERQQAFEDKKKSYEDEIEYQRHILELEDIAIQNKLEEYIEDARQVFSSIIFDLSEEKSLTEKEIQKVLDILQEHKKKQDAINEQIIRNKEKEKENNFYRIIIPKSDKEDIITLRAIEEKLHNKEALHKLLYSVFYQKPLGEMVNRILGGRDVCGIYKIENIKTKECYIGKSTNLKRRWTEHIKTSLDIGSIAKTKIHTALKEEGIDAFTFECIEEVSKEKYTEREKYWISFYNSSVYGYNLQK